ncbi:MS18A protein, partial [Amia calva]|nr:MS18A protein [Amia calva]
MDDDSATMLKECNAGEEEEEEEDEDDNVPPVVFLCVKCKVALGDSLAWVGSEDEQNLILLTRATDNVCVGNEHFVSRMPKESGCLLLNLYCRGCSLQLGKMYTSTPKNLDYKRSLFCLSIEQVESYVLGSTTQKICPEDEDDPVTLEHRVYLEHEIEKVKAVVVSVEQRLSEIESKLLKKAQ